MKIHVVKALWRSTAKTLLIKARNAQDALDKAFKDKSCEGAIEFQHLGIRDAED